MVNTKDLMECLSNTVLLPTFQKFFSQLLFHFEVAIPFDESHLFFPSLLLTRSQFHYLNLCYSFPRNVNLEKTVSELTNKYSSNQGVIEHGLVGPVNIVLWPTGLCYRRYFVLTVAPASIWPRLISRCLTNSKFLEIVKKNCLSTLPFQLLQDLGKTRVGNSVLEWIYWKNGIELRLGGMTLLQMSSVDLTGCNKGIESIPLHAQIRDMYIHDGDEWLRLPLAFTGGLEVIVPECILISKGDSPGATEISVHTSAQIFTHTIEIIDEVFMEWFSCTNTGSGIQVASESLISFTPCPICVGDSDMRNQNNMAIDLLTYSRIHRNPSAYSINQISKHCQNTTNGYTNCTKKSTIDTDRPEVIVQAGKFKFDNFNSAKRAISNNLVGFTTSHCLWIGQDQDHIECPKHGKLELQHLTPDLVK